MMIPPIRIVADCLSEAAARKGLVRPDIEAPSASVPLDIELVFEQGIGVEVALARVVFVVQHVIIVGDADADRAVLAA